jgi:hypothetical protein
LVGTLSDELVTGVTLNTVELLGDQVKGPTTPVISTPLLKAVACNVICWFDDRQLLFAVKGTAHAAGTICCPGQAGGGEFTGTTWLIWMLSMGG